MDLHPAAAVEDFAVRHCDALSLIHRDLADAVPEAFAMLEPLHPDGVVHGGVLSAVVRDGFLARLTRRGMKVGGLVASEGGFVSVRFADQPRGVCEVHMHPKNLKTGRYLPTTTAPEGLWDDGFAGADYVLSVLWRPSCRAKGLRSASLAAVTSFKDRNQTLIYASTPLPPIDMDSYWTPSVTEDHFEPADDFDDLLPGEEEIDDWSE